MPKLDQRLIAVTRRIGSGVHADIGSDHGLLLASLLGSGRIDYGIAIENMGAENMIAILRRHPDRIPNTLVLQPNSRAELVRQWAWDAGFWLVAEEVVRTTGKYAVLSFERAPAEGEQCDPAYTDIDRDCGFAFGPLMLKENSPAFVSDLLEEEIWWSRFRKLQPQAEHRLKLIQKVLTLSQYRSNDFYHEIHE